MGLSSGRTAGRRPGPRRSRRYKEVVILDGGADATGQRHPPYRRALTRTLIAQPLHSIFLSPLHRSGTNDFLSIWPIYLRNCTLLRSTFYSLLQNLSRTVRSWLAQTSEEHLQHPMFLSRSSARHSNRNRNLPLVRLLLLPYVRQGVVDHHDQPERSRAGPPAVYSAVPNPKTVSARIRRGDSGGGMGTEGMQEGALQERGGVEWAEWRSLRNRLCDRRGPTRAGTRTGQGGAAQPEDRRWLP
jgi:hypothetical protein